MTDGSAELSDLLMTAFKRAIADGQMDVAEHLLQALELLGKQAKGGGQSPTESRVTEAYWMITKLGKPPSP